MTVEELYLQQIRNLPVEARLRLMALIADELAAQPLPAAQATHSILELRGLGKEIWEGIDAQEYVNELRAEWEDRP